VKNGEKMRNAALMINFLLGVDKPEDWDGHHFKLWNGLPAILNHLETPPMAQVKEACTKLFADHNRIDSRAHHPLNPYIVTLSIGNKQVHLAGFRPVKIGVLICSLKHDDGGLANFNVAVYSDCTYIRDETGFKIIETAIRTKSDPDIQALLGNGGEKD
jgi:hypothetical protein